MAKQIFPVTGKHLIAILNAPTFRNRLERCNWRIGNVEKGFDVKQRLYSPSFSFGRLEAGNEDTFMPSSMYRKPLASNYVLMGVHSHCDLNAVAPSIGGYTEGLPRGDLLFLNLERMSYKDSANLGINPISGIIGIPKGDSVDLLLVQEAKDLTPEIIDSNNDLFNGKYPSSTREVAEELDKTKLWRALAVQIELGRDLPIEYARQLDRFSFTPELIR